VGVQFGAILVASLLAFMSAPAAAITYGTIDFEHGNVGAIVLNLPGYLWYEWCSGSLISKIVFLTAGHCIADLIEEGIPLSIVFVTFSPYLADTSQWRPVTATVIHPDYWWGPYSDPHDLGAVILQNPVEGIAPVDLAPVGYLDGVAGPADLEITFANVGYGQNEFFFVPGWRMISYSGFLSLHEAWLYMTQNPHTDNGGTCCGDSGGPTFHQGPSGTEYVVAVTSWGDSRCVATNINYRVDTPSARGFIDTLLVLDG